MSQEKMSGEEVVFSSRRPLVVQRSTSTEIPDVTGNPGHPSIPKQEYYNEEIEHHAHVVMETPRTLSDVIADMDLRTFFYFAFLVTASMFISLGAEVPTPWMVSAISVVSIALFRTLKL